MRRSCRAGSAFRLPQEQLSDLHRVGSRALAELVADHPEAEAGRARQVLADPPDEAVVLPLDVDRHRIMVLRRVVTEMEPREPFEERARSSNGSRGSISDDPAQHHYPMPIDVEGQDD